MLTPSFPILSLALFAAACTASTHPTQPSDLGKQASSDELVAGLATPGPIRFSRVVAADWQVDRAGLINLDHPLAKAAGIEGGLEPIQIYFYVLDHPSFGTYIVDSGVGDAFTQPEADTGVSFLVEQAMNMDLLKIHTSTGAWLKNWQTGGGELSGVFLTHVHLDHVMGLRDVPSGTPVYAGPGETSATAFVHMFIQGTLDYFLETSGPLREWQFTADDGNRFEGVVDIFGDGSAYALHIPGHTLGSTAFLVRTTEGAKLLVGDGSHTAFGWENGVESGTFSHDGPRSVESLSQLRRFAAAHPDVEVHIGHQELNK
ncbi:MAG: N-acyl homoserine lactone hydrolase [Hyphomicrobiaceae bacterium]|jgi:N-acyl homoserine lactone hydrolase